MMHKTITKTACMKGEYVCALYPTKLGLEKDEDGKLVECKFHPDTYRIYENRRPECWYCNRAKDKIKKDRYKA